MNTAAAYNENMDAEEQITAEEEIAGIVFEALRGIGDKRGLDWGECDELAVAALNIMLLSFPPDYQVHEDDYKRIRRDLALTIWNKAGGVAGRALGEEGCAQLGRDLLLEAVAFLRPDLTE